MDRIVQAARGRGGGTPPVLQAGNIEDAAEAGAARLAVLQQAAAEHTGRFHRRHARPYRSGRPFPPKAERRAAACRRRAAGCGGCAARLLVLALGLGLLAAVVLVFYPGVLPILGITAWFIDRLGLWPLIILYVLLSLLASLLLRRHGGGR